MKAITTININAGFEAGRKQLVTRLMAIREVVIMNFISNIMIKDNDIKKSNVENKRVNSNRDYGLNLYNSLEYCRDNSSKTNHNQQLEMICNRLV